MSALRASLEHTLLLKSLPNSHAWIFFGDLSIHGPLARHGHKELIENMYAYTYWIEAETASHAMTPGAKSWIPHGVALLLTVIDVVLVVTL